MLKDVIKSQLNRVNPETLLTGMSITGVVSVAYLTGRASFKAARLIDREEKGPFEAKPKNLTRKEKAKLVWPLYVAPGAIATSTIVCIVLSNQRASKKVAAAMTAAGISERALQEYKAKVVEKFGEGKAQVVKDEIAKDRVSANPPPSAQVIITGAGDVLCYDAMTDRYFVSSVEKIRQGANKVNYDIINTRYASLSAFYDEIGLKPTPYSDSVGWNSDHLIEVEFSTTMTDDQRPCIVVDFESPPFPSYDRLW